MLADNQTTNQKITDHGCSLMCSIANLVEHVAADYNKWDKITVKFSLLAISEFYGKRPCDTDIHIAYGYYYKLFSMNNLSPDLQNFRKHLLREIYEEMTCFFRDECPWIVEDFRSGAKQDAAVLQSHGNLPQSLWESDQLVWELAEYVRDKKLFRNNVCAETSRTVFTSIQRWMQETHNRNVSEAIALYLYVEARNHLSRLADSMRAAIISMK